jgi:hypothetical protein
VEPGWDCRVTPLLVRRVGFVAAVAPATNVNSDDTITSEPATAKSMKIGFAGEALSRPA